MVEHQYMLILCYYNSYSTFGIKAKITSHVKRIIVSLQIESICYGKEDIDEYAVGYNLHRHGGVGACTYSVLTKYILDKVMSYLCLLSNNYEFTGNEMDKDPKIMNQNVLFCCMVLAFKRYI